MTLYSNLSSASALLAAHLTHCVLVPRTFFILISAKERVYVSQALTLTENYCRSTSIGLITWSVVVVCSHCCMGALRGVFLNGGRVSLWQIISNILIRENVSVAL